MIDNVCQSVRLCYLWKNWTDSGY